MEIDCCPAPPWALEEIPARALVSSARHPLAMTHSRPKVSRTIWKPSCLRPMSGSGQPIAGGWRPCARVNIGWLNSCRGLRFLKGGSCRGCWSKPITASGRAAGPHCRDQAQCLAFGGRERGRPKTPPGQSWPTWRCGSGYSCLIAAADTFPRGAVPSKGHGLGEAQRRAGDRQPQRQRRSRPPWVFDAIGDAQARAPETGAWSTRRPLRDQAQLDGRTAKVRRIIDRPGASAAVESLLVL